MSSIKTTYETGLKNKSEEVRMKTTRLKEDKHILEIPAETVKNIKDAPVVRRDK